MADPADTLEGLMSCLVCFSNFQEEGEHVPRLLPCTHTLCEDCIKKLIQRDNKLLCPECRTTHEAKSKEKSFPQNKYILTLTRRKSNKLEDEEGNVEFAKCEQHGKELNLFCQEPECDKPICRSCLTKYHKKHDFVEIEEKEKEAILKKVTSLRSNLQEKMRIISALKRNVAAKTEVCVNDLKSKKKRINKKFNKLIKQAELQKTEATRQLNNEFSAMKTNVNLLESIWRTIETTEDMKFKEITNSKESIAEIENNNREYLSGIRTIKFPKYAVRKEVENIVGEISSEEITVHFPSGSPDLENELRNIKGASEVKCTVSRTRSTAMGIFSSMTLLTDGTVVVCGKEKAAWKLKLYNMKTGAEIDNVELKDEPRGIVEVTIDDQLALAVAYPSQQRIEFLNVSNLHDVLFSHSVAPLQPGALGTVMPSVVICVNQSELPRKIYWLDCSREKVESSKRKTVDSETVWDVLFEKSKERDLLITAERLFGLKCYNLNTYTVEWSVRGKLSGMMKELDAFGMTTDGRGHLFICDYTDGNRCIQMFTLSDGKYLGSLMKRGEQGLGIPGRICWCEPSSSLVVTHTKDYTWFFSNIIVKYDRLL